jgi:hypothetical protein
MACLGFGAPSCASFLRVSCSRCGAALLRAGLFYIMARIRGGSLGKIIHTTNASTQREQSIRMIAFVLPEFSKALRTEDDTLDMAAFVFAHLKTIANSVDQTALAWEKRDYWVKADAFRRQWAWVDKPSRVLEEQLRRKDLPSLAGVLRELSRVLPPPKSAQKAMRTTPWTGFWKKMFTES